MHSIGALLYGALHDIRHGARLLWRSPWFTMVGVATMAIGLGSSVALFTMMNAALFRPLPGRDTADLHVIYTSDRSGGGYGGSSFADFLSFTSAGPALFAGACATESVRANLVVDGTQRALTGAVVNGGCFEALRVGAQPGRVLTASDDAPSSAPASLVISHALWRRVFAADPAVIGRSGTLGGAPVVIVGVAERGFAGVSFDEGVDFWVSPTLAPILIGSDTLLARGDRRFRVYVRLADGVTTAQAADRLAAVAAQLRSEDPRAWVDVSGATRKVTIAREIDLRFAGSSAAAFLAMSFLGGVAVIVLITCVNLATMILARATARSHELSVRLALGASRGRLLRQLGTESLLISAAGVIGGGAVVAAALRLFEVYRPVEVPAFDVALDWRVGAFALALTLATPILFGVMPGAHAMRLALADGLKGRPRMVRRGDLRIGSRELLLLAQVSISFALLLAATLFMRSLMTNAADAETAGADRIGVVPIDLNTDAGNAADRAALAERLLQAASRVPGVDGATAVAVVPQTGSFIGFAGRIDDQPAEMELDGNIVAPGYFELAGIALRDGRTFDARDHARAPLTAVVSESMARQLWSSRPALGRQIHTETGPRTVIGVVADVIYRPEAGAEQPVLYLPLSQSPATRFVVHAHVQHGGQTIAALDRALRDVDGRVLVGPAMSMAQLRDQVRIPARVTQWVGSVAGVLQLGLVLMTTWSLVAYAITRRTAEIAVRRALGASEANILRLVMWPSLSLLAFGAVLGCAGGVAAAVVLHSTFLGLAPLDLAAVVPALILLLPIVALGSWLPARRAIAIEPASALKQI
jgi:predicted permease